jgi:hypothetical protein
MAKRTYATLQVKSADLASDFGLGWATSLFGAEAIGSLPVRASGKNKGKPKGFVIWRKAASAGYCREVCSPVAIGQFTDAWIGVGCFVMRGGDGVMNGMWLGRVQPLSASCSAGYFFDKGRARWAEEKARDDARWKEEREEMNALYEGTKP